MFLILVVALSLSMDAFSLALAYGMYDFNKKDTLILSLIVGLYHFFMPMVGYKCGSLIFEYVPVKPNLVIFIIFLIIGLEMIVDSFHHNIRRKINGYIEMLLFGFAVSIDSFSTGIGIKTLTSYPFFAYITFSTISFSLTYIGLVLGQSISSKIGVYSNIIGAIVLIMIGIFYIFK